MLTCTAYKAMKDATPDRRHIGFTVLLLVVTGFYEDSALLLVTHLDP